MWILQGMNAMYASQARLGTNDLAEKVENLFNYDFKLEKPGGRPENLYLGPSILPHPRAKVMFRKRKAARA